MICYFSQNYKNINNAGNKAKTDIEEIWKREGFENIGLPQSTGKNKIAGFLRTLVSVLKASLRLHRNDILLLQYPLKKYYAFMCRVARLKGAKTVTLIHDLGSFRRRKLTVPQEIKRLNLSHYVIAHNASMQKWLQDNGLSAKCGCLEIFDYLSPHPTPERQADASAYRVVYAGGLHARKNRFLYDIGEFAGNYHINLYGRGFESQEAKGREHFTCKGFVPSDKLIECVEGDFGLVWDGDSLSECAGEWGSYLKYNNPHKTSLYIRCELPVIIWKEAALASFVAKKGIGLCVDNLQELNTRLNALSAEEYLQMKRNIHRVSEELAQGHYCRKATREAVETLK